MTTGPGGGMVPYGYAGMRASTADRERAVDVLKAAFAEGRLDRDEYADRVGQAYASRTYADLGALTADLPAGPLGAMPPDPLQPIFGPPVPRPAERQTDTLAIAAFVFALGAWVTAGLTAPVALGLAVGAALRMRRSGDNGQGLAVAAVVLATLNLLIVHSLWWL